MMSTITEIRERLEAKAGDVAGTRPYWDCVNALLDVADAAQEVALGPVTVANRARLAEVVAALDDLLPQKGSDDA